MPQIKKITDLTAPELDLFSRYSESQLFHINEPKPGIFIAESPNVIERALNAGYEPLAVLIEEKQADDLIPKLYFAYPELPVYTAKFDLLTNLTGFALTRGLLCAMKRNLLPSVAEICEGKHRIAVLENVMNPTNIGAIFRSAAALGMDAVLLTSGCSDPLYRRAARVSMGTVIQIPWTFFPKNADLSCGGLETLRSLGFQTAAMALKEDSVSIDDPKLLAAEKLAVILGTGGDNSSFYGTGAAALAANGSLTLTGGTITTDAKGGAGVFSYGNGNVTVSDTTITTKQDTSGGIHVAGGGTLTASNLTVETNGESSAAIRSDRGGGTMTVDGGTYTSRGTGSPAVYCTADITVNNAALTAENSEAVCIEGLNSLSLTNCSLSGNIPENEQNDCDWTVILYQSMSGDSEVGESKFSMDGGSLTSLNGGLFYTTNTESSFYLKNVDIAYSPSNNFFLKCTGNANKRGWGQSGNNGADCTFTADSQEMSGDILWDSISNLDLKLTNGTILTGSILQDETNAGDGGNGTCNVTIDALSAWTVTGNSTVTSLTCNGSITGDDGKSVTIAGTDGTVFVQGTGKYTITTGSYNE